MNCTKMRELLPALLYGDVSAYEKIYLEKHLSTCAECKRAYHGLQGVRRLLGTDATSGVYVDLPRLYRLAADQGQRKLKRWRRAAVVSAGVAAVLAFFAFGLRLEVRAEAHQLVLRWGSAPVHNVEAPISSVKVQTAPASVPGAQTSQDMEQLQLLSRLIHALADDMQEQDRQQRLGSAELLARVEAIERQCSRRYAALEKNIDNLYRLSQKAGK